jgi:hypothetical protein
MIAAIERAGAPLSLPFIGHIVPLGTTTMLRNPVGESAKALGLDAGETMD